MSEVRGDLTLLFDFSNAYLKNSRLLFDVLTQASRTEMR